MPKLSKRVVEAAEPQGRDYFLWCDELPGFGVRIFASGRRSYLVQYRASGRSRRFTIGLHGTLTADEARREAKGLLGQVAKGEDPAEERATRRGSMTMAELCDAYLAAADRGLIMGKSGQAKKASTLYVDRGRIERHIKPLLGRRLVAELTTPDVQRFVRDVQAGKTAGVVKTGFRGKAVVEGGPGTAARTVGLLGGILSYAVSERVITINPATGVKRPADKKRKRRLTPDEYAALGKALAEAEEGGSERWQAVAGVRLLALEEQTRVALALLRSRGGRPQDWAPFNPALRAAIRRGDRAPLGVGVAKDAAALEPKLIKGLDGKEGLDLGNGTMRMPDGSIRSITRSGLEIPDAPAGGIGGGGCRGMSELREHVAELGRHIERFGQSGFHGQIEVTGLRQAGLRATAIRVRSRGGLTADMSITCPSTKEDLSDRS